jgi:hypothetical protein
MSINSINTFSPLSNTKIIASVPKNTDTTLNPILDINVNSSVSAANNAGLLTLDILNTLQNFGLDTSVITPDKKNSIQNFVSCLYQSLLTMNSDTRISSSNNINSLSNQTTLNLTDTNTTPSNSESTPNINSTASNPNIERVLKVPKAAG